MKKITTEDLEAIGFTLQDNKWVHKKGTFIYANKIENYTLNEIVDILTGTAFKKGLINCHNNEGTNI